MAAKGARNDTAEQVNATAATAVDGTWSRRDLLLGVGACAASMAFFQGDPLAHAGEAGGSEQSRVHRFAGPHHFPIGRIGDEDVSLVVDLPQGGYLLPARPRTKETAEAGDLPLTWVARCAGSANWDWLQGALLLCVLPRGSGAPDPHKRVHKQMLELVAATGLRWIPKELSSEKDGKVTVPGLPKGQRTCTVVNYETKGKASNQAHLAWLVVPTDECDVLVFIGETRGSVLARNFLRSLKVAACTKLPKRPTPLAFQVRTGVWFLRGGFSPPRGFSPDYRPDLPAAFLWTNPEGARWTVHVDPLEGNTAAPAFVEHHLQALKKSAPGVEIAEETLKVGRESHPLFAWVRETEKGPVRTALLGTQDARARVTWILEDAPGDGCDLSRWSRRAAKDLLKRFHYWYVESDESWRARQGR